MQSKIRPNDAQYGLRKMPLPEQYVNSNFQINKIIVLFNRHFQIRDVILDDRENITVGKKLREALKTGYRYVVLFGKQVLDNDGPKVEIHCTKTSKNFLVPISEIVSFIDSLMQNFDD